MGSREFQLKEGLTKRFHKSGQKTKSSGEENTDRSVVVEPTGNDKK